MKNKIFIFILLFILFFLDIFFAEKEIKKFTIKASVLNFRSGPGKNYKIIGTVYRGYFVDLIKREGNWRKVCCQSGTLKGKIGYLHKNYLTLVKSKLFVKKKISVKKQIYKAPIYTPPANINVTLKARKMIKKIKKKMLSQSLLFLGLIKQMKPKLMDATVTVKRIAKVKIIKSNAIVLDSFINGSKAIHYPYFNEVFIVDEDGDDYYKIKLSGRRSGWIHKSFVQFFHEAKAQSIVTFNGIHKNEVSRLLEQLSEIYSLTVIDKNIADKIMSQYNLIKINNTLIYKNYKKINKYYRYSKKFYEKFKIKDNIVFYGSKISFLSKLRLWGELMLGSESTETVFVGNQVPDKIKGSKNALSIGGKYKVNPDLSLNLNFSSKKDIMLESYSNTNFSGEVNYLGVNKLDMTARGGYNSYSSAGNIRTKYKQMDFGTNLKYQLTNSTKLFFNYDFNNYTYSNDTANDYKLHRLLGEFSTRMSSNALLKLQLLFETEAGDLPNHNFTHLKPYLLYIVKNKHKFFKTRFMMDSYSFSENTLNNYSKLFGELSFGSSLSEFTLGSFYKSYSENELANYLKLILRTSRNSKDFKKRTSLSIHTNLFLNEMDSSYTDLHFEVSNLGKFMQTSFNILFKYWHHSGDKNFGEPVKPYVLDLYAKFGFNLKYLVIGPVIGIHGNIALSDKANFYKRNGNLLRFGGFADLKLPFSKKFNIAGHGTYEFGNVYTDNYTGFNDRTGDIIVDGVYLRHPTTMHINVSANYKYNTYIKLYVRGGYYLVRTGFESIPGMYPTESNSRFYLFGGAVFRLN